MFSMDNKEKAGHSTEHINIKVSVHLRKAALENRCDIVREYLRQGAKPSMDVLTDVLLKPSCRGEMRRLLLNSGIDPNQFDSCGQTALSLAALDGDFKSTEILLAMGANVNMSPVMRKSPYKPGGFNIQTRYNPPLISAVIARERGSIDVVRKLLKHNADINCVNTFKSTPLIEAIVSSRYFTQINKSTNSSDPESVSDVRKIDDITSVTNCRSNAAIISLLIEKGANVNASRADGETALIAASWKPNVAIVSQLLDKGADVKAVNKYGETPLGCASSLGNCEIVSLLLNHGAHIDSRGCGGGVTPLMLAAGKNNCEVVSLLVDRGADVNLVNSRGETAMRIAIQAGHVFPELMYDCHIGRLENDPLVFLRSQIPSHLWSPLLTALYSDRLETASQVYRQCLLTPFDIFQLPKDMIVRKELSSKPFTDHRESLEFLDGMSSCVPPLFQMTFVTISVAVGYRPGRKERLEQLPLPGKLKRCLNFS